MRQKRPVRFHYSVDNNKRTHAAIVKLPDRAYQPFGPHTLYIAILSSSSSARRNTADSFFYHYICMKFSMSRLLHLQHVSTVTTHHSSAVPSSLVLTSRQALSTGKLRQNRTIMKASSSSDDDMKAQQMQKMEEMMQNPAVAAQMKAMEEAMVKPEVQQEMATMAATMQNPKFQEQVAALREDPELKPLFDQIRSGGPLAMMKAMQDPEFLAKIGSKLNLSDMGSMPVSPPSPPPPPEVKNILDAAKYGDIEAIEDFLAVGKAGDRDDNERTALHYAVAYDKRDAVDALLQGGIDVNAVDDKKNTSLHYAAGYGREVSVKALINAGASVSLKNSDGQTAADVVQLEPRNPLNHNSELMNLLKGGN